jgi:rRNA maturation endonuclease Nob1
MRIPDVGAEVAQTWRLVCHACGVRYPHGAAVSVSNADCCEKPRLHLHNTTVPCDLCS